MVGTVSLYKAQKSVPLQVASVPDVGLLQNLGLRVGTKVAVQHRYAFGGPVLLDIENSFSVALGKDIATQIIVGGLPKHELP
ncbi:MAG: ferrous iron transport protein A [Defluviitaleaceae bacterium]|nr:ferrous iron transport protein A [Defluviitaleaceae bacterium]